MLKVPELRCRQQAGATYVKKRPVYVARDQTDRLVALNDLVQRYPSFLVRQLSAASFVSRMSNKLGSDAFDALKGKIKELLAHREQDTNERLFEFIAILNPNGHRVEVHVIVTNPTAQDVDRFFAEVLPRLDELIANCLDSQPNICKLVFEYQESSVELRFGVRRDAVPLFPESS